VRAQVDRDLTTVSWVDRLLGLVKNLGRHRKRRATSGQVVGFGPCAASGCLMKYAMVI
jgi:hypothetical protein